MTRLLWIAALLAALAILPLYLLAPLQVWRTNRLPRPRVRTLGPATAGDEVREAVRALAPAARALGFDLLAVHDANDGMATVMHCYSDRARTHLVHNRTAEATWQVFLTRFDGGRAVVTSNSPTPPVFERPEGVSSCAAPPDTSLAELERLHRAHLSLRAPLGPPLTPEESGFSLEGYEREIMDQQVSLGTYRPDPDGYRPTLRGAFVMTYRQLPPLRGQRARANARLLQEIRNAAD